MTNDELQELSEDLKEISSHFEEKPWTDNMKLLKEDFDITIIKPPKHYVDVIDEITELYRQTRVLFLYSILSKVCKEEGKLYNFDTPFQAGMRYDGVMKKEGSFYLLDEDGDYRDILTSESFVHFIDNFYWEQY